MSDESKIRAVAATMRRINRAWLEGSVEDFAPMIHPDIVMVLPGFTDRVAGREAFLSGFREFFESASVHEFSEDDQQVDVAGSAAVLSFGYEMVYERSGERYRATGRDLWVFQQEDDAWLAVWRTMLDLDERPA